MAASARTDRKTHPSGSSAQTPPAAPGQAHRRGRAPASRRSGGLLRRRCPQQSARRGELRRHRLQIVIGRHCGIGPLRPNGRGLTSRSAPTGCQHRRRHLSVRSSTKRAPAPHLPNAAPIIDHEGRRGANRARTVLSNQATSAQGPPQTPAHRARDDVGPATESTQSPRSAGAMRSRRPCRRHVKTDPLMARES